MTAQQYSFNHWELCFDDYENLLKTEEQPICLIVSTHPFSSGYWIEDANAKLTNGDIKYIGKEVMDLKEALTSEIASAKKEGRRPKLIY